MKYIFSFKSTDVSLSLYILFITIIMFLAFGRFRTSPIRAHVANLESQLLPTLCPFTAFGRAIIIMLSLSFLEH